MYRFEPLSDLVVDRKEGDISLQSKGPVLAIYLFGPGSDRAIAQ